MTESLATYPPEFSADSATRVVFEGADAGTSIVSPVTATDGDSGDIRLTYWLSDADASLFDIDAMTGQIDGGRGETLDYRSRLVHDRYQVTVAMQDSSAPSRSRRLTHQWRITLATALSLRDHQRHRRGREADVQYRRETDNNSGGYDRASGRPVPTSPTRRETRREGSVTLSLTGVDSSKFELNDPVTAAVAPDYVQGAGLQGTSPTSRCRETVTGTTYTR